MKYKSLLALVLVVTFITAGCSTTRFESTIKKQSFNQQGLAGYKLKIVSLTISRIGPYDTSGFTVKNDKYMKIAIERYPEIFSYEDSALPVAIQLYEKESSSSDLAFWSTFWISIFSLATLPVYQSKTISFDGDVRFSDMASHEFCAGQASFVRTDAYWATILSPIGLLPVPGESDSPQYTYIADKNRIDANGQSANFDIISAIDTVVKAAIDCGPQAFNHIKTKAPLESK
jgi:hypothetical protein